MMLTRQQRTTTALPSGHGSTQWGRSSVHRAAKKQRRKIKPEVDTECGKVPSSFWAPGPKVSGCCVGPAVGVGVGVGVTYVVDRWEL